MSFSMISLRIRIEQCTVSSNKLTMEKSIMYDYSELRDVMQRFQEEGYEVLRTGDVVAAQDKFRMAEWLAELLRMRDAAES